MKNNRPSATQSRQGHSGTQGPGACHSVELNIDGVELPYQFKIWDLEHGSMCVLVNENSNLVPRLKVGVSLKAKYYYRGSATPSNYHTAEVSRIVKNDQGRLRGHYLVGLEVHDG